MLMVCNPCSRQLELVQPRPHPGPQVPQGQRLGGKLHRPARGWLGEAVGKIRGHVTAVPVPGQPLATAWHIRSAEPAAPPSWAANAAVTAAGRRPVSLGAAAVGGPVIPSPDAT